MNFYFKFLTIQIALGYLLNAQSLDLSVTDLNPDNKIVVKNATTQFAIMKPNRMNVRIVCNKNGLPKEGTILAVIGTTELTVSTCLSYATGFNGIDYYCITKSFTFDLSTINSPGEYFEFLCVIEETGVFSSYLKLYKLGK